MANSTFTNQQYTTPISLTTGVTGILPVGNGGTGTSTTFTAASVIFAAAGGAYTQDNTNFNYVTATRMLNVDATGTTTSLHTGPAAGTTNINVGGAGIEIITNNNTAGGGNLIVGNKNSGTSAFVDIFLQNDLADSGGTHYGVLNLNSSTYSDTAFGTILAVPNQIALYGTDGPTTIGAGSSTSNGWVSFFSGGMAAANERARFLSTGEFGVGITAPTASLHLVTTKTTGTGLSATSSTLTTGTVGNFAMTTTAIPTSNNTAVVTITASGANANNSAAATGAKITLTNTGSNSTNYGLLISTTGASGNAALVTDAGIYIGSLTPQLNAGTYIQATPSTTAQKASAFTGNAINSISAAAGANAILLIEGNGSTNNRVGILALRDNPSTSFAYNVASSVSSILGAVTFEGFSVTTGTSRLSSYIQATVTTVQTTTLSSKLDFFMTNAAGTSATRFTIGDNGNNVSTQGVNTSGSPTAFLVTGGAHTTLTASTEAIDVNLNLARTVQFATGALATQRSFVVQAPTIGFVGASTITTNATMAITGAPVSGTNATVTTKAALWIQGGAVTSATTAIGLLVDVPTGATTNIAARFNSFTQVFGNGGPALQWGNTTGLGTLTYLSSTPYIGGVAGAITIGNTNGNVNINATSVGTGFSKLTAQVPTAVVHIEAGTTAASTAPLKFTTGPVMTGAEAGAFEYTTPQLFFTNGGAQRQEIPQIQQSRVATQFDATTNTTLAAITDLTATLVAGKKYYFEANLYVDANVVGGSKYDMSGTATATSIIYELVLIDNATNANTITSRGIALASSVGQAGTTAGFVRITGMIVCNGAGTLTPRFAQNASNGTSSVLVNSNFMIREIA